jgi:hypothetical protein
MEDEEKYKSGTVEERVAYPDGLSEEQSNYLSKICHRCAQEISKARS